MRLVAALCWTDSQCALLREGSLYDADGAEEVGRLNAALRALAG